MSLEVEKFTPASDAWLLNEAVSTSNLALFEKALSRVALHEVVEVGDVIVERDQPTLQERALTDLCCRTGYEHGLVSNGNQFVVIPGDRGSVPLVDTVKTIKGLSVAYPGEKLSVCHVHWAAGMALSFSPLDNWVYHYLTLKYGVTCRVVTPLHEVVLTYRGSSRPSADYDRLILEWFDHSIDTQINDQ